MAELWRGHAGSFRRASSRVIFRGRGAARPRRSGRSFHGRGAGPCGLGGRRNRAKSGAAHQFALGRRADRLQIDARRHGLPRGGRRADFGVGEYRQQFAFYDSGLLAGRDCDFGRAFARRAHRHRIEIRYAGTCLRRTAGDGRTGTAQCERFLAFVLAAGHGQRQKKHGQRNSDAAGIFSLHSRAGFGAAESGVEFPAARLLSPGRLRHSNSLPFRVFREDAHGDVANGNSGVPARRSRRITFTKSCHC